jgi:16S rRNA (guanine527-N7)-methyltransferase
MPVQFESDDFQRDSGASDAQMADMTAYRALIEDWNGRMNLVGPSALETFWLRHAWDSAQLLLLEPSAKVWADIGAGAGLPGLVLAILLKDTPDAKVHLVESMAKRCRFLSEVVERLALPAVVHNQRAEDVAIDGVEIVTARACAPMTRLLSFAEPLLKRGARGVFLKGRDVAAELIEARKSWTLDLSLLPSRSDPDGNIVIVEAASRG